MATEQEAKKAVETHARMLRKLGAHSVGTADGKGHGLKGHVVVVNVPPGFAGKLPSEIDYTSTRAHVKVPVVTREMEQFKAEKL